MRPHPPRPRLARAVAALAATALCLATTACDTTERADSTGAAASQEASPTDGSPSPSPSEEPTESTSPEEVPTEEATEEAEPPASPSGSPTATANARFPDRLLAADQMPGFNEEWTWQEGSTRRHEGRRPFATCHKFAMTTIGAWRVVARDYTVGPGEAGGGSTASHLVAEFADRQTARRTFEVLRTWRGQCPEELEGYDRVKVSPLRPVDVAGGEAGWYLLTYGPPEDGGAEEAYFDAQGLTLVGKRISVLQMRTVAQDYNYPPGEEPMVEAVRTAAAELG